MSRGERSGYIAHDSFVSRRMRLELILFSHPEYVVSRLVRCKTMRIYLARIGQDVMNRSIENFWTSLFARCSPFILQSLTVGLLVHLPDYSLRSISLITALLGYSDCCRKYHNAPWCRSMSKITIRLIPCSRCAVRVEFRSKFKRIQS